MDDDHGSRALDVTDLEAVGVEDFFVGESVLERGLRDDRIIKPSKSPCNHPFRPDPNRLAEKAGQYSIRVNDQWRICFVWTEGGADDVELTDYH